MPTAPYHETLRAHLAAYKRRRLGVIEDGVWLGNGREYDHILPGSLERLNILEGIRREFWDYFEAHERQLSLHTDFRHLNSSQAFAFNLLFPFVGSATLSAPLCAALGSPGRSIVAASFEHVPDPAERTTVDLHATLDDGTRLLVEVKLTEPHFGQCVPGETHRRKYLDHYLPRLSGLARPESVGAENFFLNYQLFRNVSHLDVARGDVLVLLLPRANTVTWDEGRRFMESCLLEAAREHVRLVAAEDVAARLRDTLPADAARLRAHLELLAEKYFPAEV